MAEGSGLMDDHLVNPPVFLTEEDMRRDREEVDEAMRCIRERKPYVPLWWQRMSPEERAALQDEMGAEPASGGATTK